MALRQVLEPMIRYSITEDDLRAKIEAEKAGWLDRAKDRTDGFITAGEYEESSSIWSEIKKVYMRLQYDKCAYCERKLADENDGGTIEHDVEHYRPKNTVPEWPTDDMEDEGITFNFATGDELTNGYYWLAYEPLNYCTSCKKCNSPLKKNWFPIADNRGQATDDSETLNAAENPFLPYPIGTSDDDPIEIIAFDGISPVPVKRSGPKWRRAKVTIAFFRLDTREELLRERAELLISLHDRMSIIDSNLPAARREQAKEDIKRMRSDRAPHASCVRSECKAWIDDPDRMLQLTDAARDYVDPSN